MARRHSPGSLHHGRKMTLTKCQPRSWFRACRLSYSRLDRYNTLGPCLVRHALSKYPHKGLMVMTYMYTHTHTHSIAFGIRAYSEATLPTTCSKWLAEVGCRKCVERKYAHPITLYQQAGPGGQREQENSQRLTRPLRFKPGYPHHLFLLLQE